MVYKHLCKTRTSGRSDVIVQPVGALELGRLHSCYSYTKCSASANHKTFTLSQLQSGPKWWFGTGCSQDGNDAFDPAYFFLLPASAVKVMESVHLYVCPPN